MAIKNLKDSGVYYSGSSFAEMLGRRINTDQPLHGGGALTTDLILGVNEATETSLGTIKKAALQDIYDSIQEG